MSKAKVVIEESWMYNEKMTVGYTVSGLAHSPKREDVGESEVFEDREDAYRHAQKILQLPDAFRVYVRAIYDNGMPVNILCLATESAAKAADEYAARIATEPTGTAMGSYSEGLTREDMDDLQAERDAWLPRQFFVTG